MRAAVDTPFPARLVDTSRGAPSLRAYENKSDERQRMTIDNVAEQVVQAYEGALKSYRNAQESDRMEQARVTGRVSSGDKFAYAHFEDVATNAVYAERDRAMNAVNAALASREAELTAPPSAEAVNYLASIAGRDDLSDDEVNSALDRYGKTHAAQKAIINAAKRSGVLIVDARTETERDIQALRELAARVEREFSPLKMSAVTDGKAWLIKAGMRGQL